MIEEQVLQPDGTLKERPPRGFAAVLASFGDRRPEPLELLTALQARYRFLSERLLRHAAQRLGAPRFALLRLIQQSPELTTQPPGQHRLRICRAESCTEAGSPQLLRLAETRLGVESEETTSDGRVTLETIYCFGHCEQAPVVGFDSALHPKTTPAQLLAWLRRLEADHAPKAEGEG